MALHIATNAHQQTSVNNFAQESQHGNIYCFGSVYPFAENALEEMRRVRRWACTALSCTPTIRSSSSGMSRSAHL